MLSFALSGWRSWQSAKVVALLAATALAVGIGSATAIFSVIYPVLLKPLPWAQGERFVSLFGADITDPVGFSSNSWLDLLEYQHRTRSFDVFGIYQPRVFSLTSPGEPQHLNGVEVTPALTNALGVNPIVGRWFGEAGSEEGSLYRAVISSGLWKRLGGDSKIVGQALTMDGRQYTVTGVMPAWFRFPLSGTNGEELRSDVWVPLNPHGPDRNRDAFSYFCYARLAPGVTLSQANADVKRVAAQIVKENPKLHPGYTAFVMSVQESMVREIRPTLLLLFGAAGVLLVITLSNVAGLLLARSVARSRETGVRIALGAALWQLALQYFVEGLLVSLAGAAGGVLISLVLLRFVLSMTADYVPRAGEIGVDWTALLFALGAAILGSALISLAPLWQAVRTLPNEVLSDGARTSAGARSRGLSRLLVIAEIALAFTLLSVSALLLTHLGDLLRIYPGFDPDRLLTFSLNSNDVEYPTSARRASYQQRLVEAIARIPGVSGAALVNQLALAGCCYVTRLSAEGSPGGQDKPETVELLVVSPRYFDTMRIPLLKGRLFDDQDGKDEHNMVIVVDASAAKRFWPAREAIGAYASVGNGARARVIGVVGDVKNKGLGQIPWPELYFPAAAVPVNPMHFVVRSPVPPAALIPEVRRAILSVDPAQPMYGAATMHEIVQGSVVTQRLQSFLTSFFAFAALLMAALGVYGTASYSVRHRTVEIGTRMALGATSGNVLRLVIGDGLRMAAYGIGAGGLAVIAAALLLRSQVFGIHIDDPRPFLYSTGIVAALTALACFFPAWRASLVSPMVAIRDDAGSLWETTRRGARRLAAAMSGLVYGSDDAAAVTEGALLAEFVEASRHAESFRQALQLALESLRAALRSESALLLENDSGQGYICAASAPRECAPGYRLPANGLLIGRLKHYASPLPLTRGDFDTWSRWAVAQKPEYATEIESLANSGVALAVPLLAKNEIAGILLLGAPAGRDQYSALERQVLRNCAGQFALMIENARLTDRIVEQEKLRRDVQLATEVQKRLFPEKPPATSSVTLAGMSLPARSVGGDYYDFLDLGGHRIGIALADVAGKGIAAALIMSIVQASLRILTADNNSSPADVVAKMNRFLYRSTGSNAYATFFYAQIDEQTRQLRYVNAGHNPPYLLRYAARREDRPIEELPAGGTVIGLFPQSSYEEATVVLQPGDVVIAFSDGVPEALNPKDEEFGEERVKTLLRQWAHLTVDEMSSRIASELKSWIGNAAQYDDLTFILLKVNAENSSND